MTRLKLLQCNHSSCYIPCNTVTIICSCLSIMALQWQDQYPDFHLIFFCILFSSLQVFDFHLVSFSSFLNFLYTSLCFSNIVLVKQLTKSLMNFGLEKSLALNTCTFGVVQLRHNLISHMKENQTKEQLAIILLAMLKFLGAISFSESHFKIFFRDKKCKIY